MRRSEQIEAAWAANNEEVARLLDGNLSELISPIVNQFAEGCISAAELVRLVNLVDAEG